MSAGAVPFPFMPRDIFITQGADIFRFSGGILNPTPFATTGCTEADSTGITFDHSATGIFGNNMIVTCKDGTVWEIDGHGNIVTGAAIANLHTEIEGPGVATAGFGFYAGQILLADESGLGWVHAVGPPPTYTVSLFVFNVPGAESIQVVPDTPCTFCSGHAFFQALPFGTSLGNPFTIYAYLPTNFTGSPAGPGDILVPSEDGGGTTLIHSTGPGPNDLV